MLAKGLAKLTELGSSGRLRELGDGGDLPTHCRVCTGRQRTPVEESLCFLGAACHGITITRAGSGMNPHPIRGPCLDVGEAVLQGEVELVARPTSLEVSRSARGTAVAPAKVLLQ